MIVDGSTSTPPTDGSGAPEGPSAQGPGPHGTRWELTVWDSAKSGKCGSIGVYKADGFAGGGGSGCGWDPRFDQDSYRGKSSGIPAIRAAYGPVMSAAVRVVLVGTSGEQTDAQLVHDAPDGTRYYIAFPDPTKKLAKALAYDESGAIIAEYRNYQAEEAGLVGRRG